MFLKQIKATGFKSFVDKVTIDFEKGITGIVGPNGSGKSNIVDAVRWVLGEQSVKSLRGDGSMTDVIFSGSKTRNPSSSASVTLVFDNQNKYFPVEYSEVSIKRTVYRTGENEYYLNGSKCRLKDITNLIVDTGMAKESFNIITQGNIQDILSSRPEDRRVIFEEAAGVLKYKKRKEEAIRKLNRTHENIERVNDIVNELEKQVEPLKEQSEKAKIYIDAKKELEQIEIALVASDIQESNEAYQYAKERIEKIAEELIVLNQEIDSNQATLEKEKFEHTKNNELLYNTQQELVNIASNVAKLSGEKNMVTERKKYHSEDVKLHDNVLLLKEHQLKIKNDIDLANSDVCDKRENLNSIDVRMQEITQKLDNYTNSKVAIAGKIDIIMRNKNEINHKIDILENSIESNLRLSYAVRAVLDNPKLRGVHNVIADLIDAKEEFLVALDTALGSSAQFIVVDNDTSAKEAIAYLKTKNIGRATFFPINIIKPRKIERETHELIKGHEAFIDIASNVVTYDNRYQNIILNQLGTVIVAKSIDGANDIGKLINYRYKIVTLDGELLHVGGSITGGNSKKNNSVLNEKYELSEFKNTIIKLDKEYNELQIKLNDVSVLVKEYELRDYNLKIEKGSVQQSIDTKLKNIDEDIARLESVNDELKGVDGVLNQMLDENEKELIDAYYEAINEKEKIIKKIEIISNKNNATKELVDETEKEIKRINNTLINKQKELKELEIKSNRLEVKLDNLLNRLNEEYSMTFEKAKKDYVLIMDEKEARKKVDENRQRIKALGLVNIAAIEEYERVSTRYEFLITQKNDLFKAENILLEIIKEMDLIMKELFEETFKLIQKEFKEVFKRLFGGGSAELRLVNPEDVLETGIEIIALPPGKKLQHISLLSGGEKALTAISLLFSILRVRPVPFCLLDEVEAALDEVNVLGFANFLKDFRDRTQFIIITHKKKTMEYVDVLYGITMQESGVSKLVSVKLQEMDT